MTEQDFLPAMPNTKSEHAIDYRKEANREACGVIEDDLDYVANALLDGDALNNDETLYEIAEERCDDAFNLESREALELILQLREYEETDRGLLGGPIIDGLQSCAGYTYQNAARSILCEILTRLDGDGEIAHLVGLEGGRRRGGRGGGRHGRKVGRPDRRRPGGRRDLAGRGRLRPGHRLGLRGGHQARQEGRRGPPRQEGGDHVPNQGDFRDLLDGLILGLAAAASLAVLLLGLATFLPESWLDWYAWLDFYDLIKEKARRFWEN